MRGYLRSPTVHSDLVVFVSDDDLWAVPAGGGTATRLTAGVSAPASPRLSPDGTHVAFVGADEGPPEVYVLPVAGGAARRLTHHGTRCAVTGWHPETGEVVFAAAAGLPAGFGTRLFAVSPEGGPSRLLPLGLATALAFGPGGRVALGRNTADPARWKRYRGGTAGEVWVATGAAGRFARLPVDGNLTDPCWIGERLHFLSDRTGVSTVHSCAPDGSGLTEHGEPLEFYARNLSGDGTRLVHQAGAELYLVEPGHPTRRLDVRLPGARGQRGRRFVAAGEHLHDAVPAPDGSGLAISARGGVFTMGNWSGPVRQRGRPAGVRYRLPRWLPDGEELVAVASDERPAEHLVSLTPDGVAEVSDVDLGVVTELAVAPVGRRVAVATGRQELHLVDLTGTVSVLDRARHGRIEDLTWSPDGRWLAYAYPESPATTGIRLVEAATGRIVAVTTPVLHDVRPSFDPDGKYLYFVGQRDFTPDHDQVAFGLGFPLGTRPYLVALAAATPSPFTPAPKPLAAEFAEPQDTARPRVDVAVDPDGIERRVVALPAPEARYQRVLGVRGGVLLLSAPVTGHSGPGGRVDLLDLATGAVDEHLTGVDDVVLSADGTTLVCRADQRVRVLRARQAPEDTASDEPGRDTGWVDLDRITVPVDPAAEWRQMFREAWRLQRENFWDRDMSGLDWDALYERYLPLVDRVASRAELSDLIWELHGELGTSHAYESGGEYRRRPEHAQGFLGVDWLVADGRWRIAEVLAGDRWDERATSPCTRPGADVRAGDEVVAVNGQPVGPAGPGALLVGLAGHEVELTVSRAGATHRVSVRASGDESPARYRDWVEGNRAVAHALSGGRVGYLHVPDMGLRGYAEFTRAFLTEHDREALVVDVRFNCGGFASWLLLEKLARRRQGHETGRWSGRAPYPQESPRGPMVALTNEHTGSDADIFSQVFRQLGLGPLVGRRTWGGVVATWPRHDLVDGTTTTQPEFAYEFTGRWLENHGVEPDFPVDPAPHEHVDGVDHQLTAAVRLAVAQLPAPTHQEKPCPTAQK